jgi:hypothetical protein
MQAGRATVRFYLLLCVAVLVSAETTARVEDWLRHGVGFLSAPDRERDLVLHDSIAIRGKPNGSYKQWQLNVFGFRNGAMSEIPPAGCTRVMTLGASETFGLFESAGMEYPAQLGRKLADEERCYEVVNAAVAGLTLRGLTRLWTGWASRFGSSLVVVYPTPAFYLNHTPPRYPERPPAAPTEQAIQWAPRLLDRARDHIAYPEFIQRRRVQLALRDAMKSMDPASIFNDVPSDRLAQFTDDLKELMRSIRATGASVIVLTHATAFRNPPNPDDIPALDAWRTVLPRATREVLLDFEDAARAATLVAFRSVADVRVVDLAGHMNGHREWFAGDFLHFNEDGAGVVARLISQEVTADANASGFTEAAADAVQ